MTSENLPHRIIRAKGVNWEEITINGVPLHPFCYKMRHFLQFALLPPVKYLIIQYMKKLLLIGFCVCLGSCSKSSTVDDGKSTDPGPARQEVRNGATPGGMNLVLLGSGTPIPETASGGPSSAVLAGDRSFVVDAGEGVVRKAQAAYESGVKPLRPDLLGVLFLTHLHSDHTLGLPDFIFTPWIVGRTQPIHVYGPSGTEEMILHIVKAWSEDLRIRQKDHPERSYEDLLQVHEIQAGQVFADGGVRVTAFRVSHGDFQNAFGYRFEYGNRSIVISGDTAPDRRVIEACDGCDILLHEVYSFSGFSRGDPDWQKYHAAYHTSSVEVARIAEEARPGKLILYHKLLFGQTEAGLLKEVTDRYAGDVQVGEDLAIY